MSKVLIETVIARLRDEIASRHPNWEFYGEGLCQFAVRGEDGTTAGSVWVENDALCYAKQVKVRPSGNVRAVAYKNLADLDTLAHRAVDRLAEGLASAQADKQRLDREWGERERRRAREAKDKAAHPLAFGEGVRWGDGALIVPQALVEVTLAMLEAHLASVGD